MLEDKIDNMLREVVSLPHIPESLEVPQEIIRARELVKAIVRGLPERRRHNYVDVVAVLISTLINKRTSNHRAYCLNMAEKWVRTLMLNEKIIELDEPDDGEAFDELLLKLDDKLLLSRVKKLGGARNDF